MLFDKNVLLKKNFLSYFEINDKLKGENIYFRWFNSNDTLKNRFSIEDWHKIFCDKSDSDLHEWQEEFINVVVLVICMAESDIPIGFVVVKENVDFHNLVEIHGGIWNHSSISKLYAYDALSTIVRFLINMQYCIKTTCFCNNHSANRFLESYGFVEYYNDGVLSFKEYSFDAKNPILRRYPIK